jgi:Ser/Thr protein kinase RdoA (MazF antagonist)
MSLVHSDLTRQLASRYRLGDVELRHLGTPVNDVVAVNSAAGEFALKLYHRKRTPQAVRWEIDLVRHLFRRGAPVAQPIRGRDGYLEHLTVADHQHIAVAENLTVFDFDSAGTSWRAVEPWGVLRSSATYFQAWVARYRTARTFGRLDEAAVAVFGIVGDLRVVAWKLGVAESSRGAPRLGIADLPAIVDGWLDLEVTELPEIAGE